MSRFREKVDRVQVGASRNSKVAVLYSIQLGVKSPVGVGKPLLPTGPAHVVFDTYGAVSEPHHRCQFRENKGVFLLRKML